MILKKGELIGEKEVYYNDEVAFIIKDFGEDGFDIWQFNYDKEKKRWIRQFAFADRDKQIKEIFQWLLGYYHFPPRGEFDGAYWWRSHLREKLKEIDFQFKEKE
jgi:hypothetical protein